VGSFLNKKQMYNLDWSIEFEKEGKLMYLALLAECEVISSVENLADVATIILPESDKNAPLVEQLKNIGRGTSVIIKMGYDGNLETEFKGFIKNITTNDHSIKIECEDDLFLFRVDVKDVEMKPTSLTKIAQYVIDQIDPSYKLDCDYEINYEKFTIHQATGFDVLSKLQSETTADIYFDIENEILHIHPPYVTKGGEVYYSMQKNIEASSLEFNNKLDAKVEVTIESTDIKGNVHKVTAGTTGGDKVTRKVGAMDEASMQKIADAELIKKSAAGYEGSFDAWLVPMVKPNYSARIKDEDYPERTAMYYVASVTTNLSASGGKRTITPSIKLS